VPSDHLIRNESLLIESLNRAISVASNGDALLTLGLTPHSPHTGYGYIKKGAMYEDGVFRVDKFCEKPNLATATEFVESSEYLWNSGMFVFSASTFLKAMEDQMPQHMEILSVIEAQIGTPLEERTIAENFSSFSPVSVDYGIMEKANNCCVVPVDNLGWSDIGSWEAWGAELPADPHNNRLFSPEPIVIDSSNTIVYSDRPVALVGIDDLIIADSGDALLICKKDRAQDVKDVVEELSRRKKTDLI
jgi:mannose-1-phosphate guanylyltransferase